MTSHIPTQLPPSVVAYVDGACNPNPGKGGWGVLLRYGPHSKQLSGLVLEERTTNQRSEIFAAIRALTALKLPCRVEIRSDSQYLVRTMQGQYRRGSNHDLWEQLDRAGAVHQVEWVWVRGHAGDEDNETVHTLAEREVA